MKATIIAVTNVVKTRNCTLIAVKINLGKICRLRKQLVMKYKILIVVIVKNTEYCSRQCEAVYSGKHLQRRHVWD
jgi:hypothetical protein